MYSVVNQCQFTSFSVWRETKPLTFLLHGDNEPNPRDQLCFGQGQEFHGQPLLKLSLHHLSGLNHFIWLSLCFSIWVLFSAFTFLVGTYITKKKYFKNHKSSRCDVQDVPEEETQRSLDDITEIKSKIERSCNWQWAKQVHQSVQPRTLGTK